MSDDAGIAGAPVVQPQIAPSPSAVNDAAIRIVQTYGTGELERVQKRAEQWIAGVTALSGLTTTALIVKGKDSFAKLDPAYRVFGVSIDPVWWVIVTLGLAYASYAVAVYSAYSAAFGDPFKTDELAQLELRVQTAPDAAATELRNAVADKAASSRSSLRRAVVFTITGMAFTSLAIVLTWRIPDKPAASAQVCVEIGAAGQTTALKFDGALPELKSGEYRVVPCD